MLQHIGERDTCVCTVKLPEWQKRGVVRKKCRLTLIMVRH